MVDARFQTEVTRDEANVTCESRTILYKILPVIKELAYFGKKRLSRPRSCRPVLDVRDRVDVDILHHDGKPVCRCGCYVTHPVPY